MQKIMSATGADGGNLIVSKLVYFAYKREGVTL